MMATPVNFDTSYKSVLRFRKALLADLVIGVILVEVLKAWGRPFEGLTRWNSLETFRIIVYGWALAQFFLMRFFGGLPLKNLSIQDRDEFPDRLRISTMIVLALCDLVAILGFVLFLLKGLRVDFYSLAGLALFYMSLFFPKKKDWEIWIEGKKNERLIQRP